MANSVLRGMEQRLTRFEYWKIFFAAAAGTVLLIVVCVAVYLRFGSPPVAVADSPFPDEKQIVHIPLHARINREMTTPPFQATAEDMVAGAHIYMQQCAMCHGTPNRRSGLANAEYPPPPQLWAKNHHGGIGVSNDAPGKVYWQVQNGIRLTAMPAYNKILSQKQEWQVFALGAERRTSAATRGNPDTQRRLCWAGCWGSTGADGPVTTSTLEACARALFAAVDDFSWRFVGGPDRDRTDDLFHAMEARSQLRHRPTSSILRHLGP